jgi:hypothetical protein
MLQFRLPLIAEMLKFRLDLLTEMLRLKLVLLVYKKNMALQLKEKQWPAVLPVWPEARQLQRRQTAPQTSSRLFWALKVKLQVFLSEKRVGLNSKVEQLKSQL